MAAGLSLAMVAVPAQADTRVIEMTAAGTLTSYSGFCDVREGAYLPFCPGYFDNIPLGTAWTLSATWTIDLDNQPFDSDGQPWDGPWEGQLTHYDLVLDTDLDHGGYLYSGEWVWIEMTDDHVDRIDAYVSYDAGWTHFFDLTGELVEFRDYNGNAPFFYGWPWWEPDFPYEIGSRGMDGSGQLTLMRIDGVDVLNSSGPVPEPASWIMLIADFGLAGGSMRRKMAKA